MLDRLDRLVDQARDRRSKLALVVGTNGSGKTALLRAFGERYGILPLSLGAALAPRLAALARPDRALEAGPLAREIAGSQSGTAATTDAVPLLLDNIEILFDATLRLDPLDLLKQIARNRPVVASWPGAVRLERERPLLLHAEHGHAEHCACTPDGVLLLTLP